LGKNFPKFNSASKFRISPFSLGNSLGQNCASSWLSAEIAQREAILRYIEIVSLQ